MTSNTFSYYKNSYVIQFNIHTLCTNTYMCFCVCFGVPATMWMWVGLSSCVELQKTAHDNADISIAVVCYR